MLDQTQMAEFIESNSAQVVTNRKLISPRDIHGLFRFLMESTVDRTTIHYQDLNLLCQTLLCICIYFCI